MKIRLSALALTVTVLLSGCASMLQRSYSSSVQHVEYTVSEDSSMLRAETYRGLVDAILYFVNEHAAQGVIRLYNYTSDVESDLARACLEITEEDPLGAFAVENITYEFSRIVSYYEVTISLSYSRTVEEVDALRLASGSSGIRARIQDAVASFSSTLLLRVSYFSEDADSIRTMVAQAYYDTPTSAFGMPEVQVSIYPETGSQRIVAIDLVWPGSRTGLIQQSSDLLRAADELLSLNPPANEAYLPVELYTIFLEHIPPIDPKGASDPLSALTGRPANQLAHTLALELLFQRTGIDATLVTGFVHEVGTCWLIVDSGDGYRHLPFVSTVEEIRLCTDLEMSGLGYLWEDDLYPDCVDYDAEVPGFASPSEELPEGGGSDTQTPPSEETS